MKIFFEKLVIKFKNSSHKTSCANERTRVSGDPSCIGGEDGWEDR